MPLLLATGLPITLPAQTGSPSAASRPRLSAPSKAQEPEPPNQPSTTPGQTLGKAEQETLARAAGKVLDEIQKQENNLYLRLTYFEKSERLDPNSFATVDEVRQWKSMLEEMKQKSQQVADLYASASKNLDTEFRNARLNEQIAARFKAVILNGFPWETIQKKNQLMQEYIGEHGKLLAFYESNWGNWKPSSDPAKPEFSSAQVAATFQRLREQIVATGQQLNAAYKSMSE